MRASPGSLGGPGPNLPSAPLTPTIWEASDPPRFSRNLSSQASHPGSGGKPRTIRCVSSELSGTAARRQGWEAARGVEVLRERRRATRVPPGPSHQGESCGSYPRIQHRKRRSPSRHGEQMEPREEDFLWAGDGAATCSRYKPKQPCRDRESGFVYLGGTHLPPEY